MPILKAKQGNEWKEVSNVVVNAGGGGIEDAPIDDKTYARKNKKWSQIPGKNEFATVNGKIITEGGDVKIKEGVTYTPHVTQTGDLTWTNNAGLPNPDKVNITGPSGATLPGQTEISQILDSTPGSEKRIISQKVVTETFDNVNKTFDKVNDDISYLKSFHGEDYCAGRWDKSELQPESKETSGSKYFATAWYPWLVDMTDNAGKKVNKKTLLKNNNWFRSADGEFSPAVCISQEDFEKCNVELYLDSQHTEKYCDAMQFDAEKFYNKYGMNTPLYDAQGAQISHIVRPWETTNKNLSIFVGRADTIRVCDQLTGPSGKTWKGVFGSQSKYDDNSFGQYKLVPTGIAPTPVCTISNKTRAFFYLMKGETNCQSSKGKENITDLFFNQKLTYPRVNDMHQINDMKWSRANNSNSRSSVPFAEGGYFAYNAFLTCMEIAYGTKYLHDPKLFSSGISSNNSCNSEESWKMYGGVRYKKSGETLWKYASWNTTPSDLCYNNNAGKTNFSELINNYHPKMGVNEAQIAASYAVEADIAEKQEFVLYGHTYWWEAPENTKSLKDGIMNARIYKKMACQINGYNPDKTPQIFDCEIVLRVGLIHGVDTSGDVFTYWGGGYEQIGTTDKDPNTSKTGFPIKLYIQPDQSQWTWDESTRIDSSQIFPSENSYIYLEQVTNLGDGYASERASYSGFIKVKGGSISTGECFYSWNNNYWGSVGKKSRIAARFRGNATIAICSARYLYATNDVSYANRHYAGSAQVLL